MQRHRRVYFLGFTLTIFIFIAVCADFSPAAVQSAGCGNWLTNRLFSSYRHPLRSHAGKLGELTILNSFYSVGTSTSRTPGSASFGKKPRKLANHAQSKTRNVLEIFDSSERCILHYVLEDVPGGVMDYSCSDDRCSYIALQDHHRLVVLQRRGPHFERIFSVGSRYHSFFRFLNGSKAVNSFDWNNSGTEIAFSLSSSDTAALNDSYVFSTLDRTTRPMGGVETRYLENIAAPLWSMDDRTVTFFSQDQSYTYNSQSGQLLEVHSSRISR